MKMMRIFVPVLTALLVIGGSLLMAGCPTDTSEPDPTPTPPNGTPEPTPPGGTPIPTPLPIPPVPPTGQPAPGANNLAFPQSAFIRGQFEGRLALPTTVTQAEMEARIIGLFENILRNNIIMDTNPNHQTRETFRIVFQHRSSYPGGGGNVHNITVSESHGYGMMILALMAGSEDRLNFDGWLFGGNIRDYFDAMVRTMQGFPSSRRAAPLTSLMSWRLWGYSNAQRDTDLFHVTNNPNGIRGGGYRLIDGVRLAPFVNEGTHLGAGGNSATDGDMDMIYGLILAHRQWGSDGVINYMEIAQRMLADFYRDCIHPTHRTLHLGDWSSWSPNAPLGRSTRASDFMLSHLITFRDMDPAHDWQAVIDATLNVIWDIRSHYNAQGHDNGLLPDFITWDPDNNRWATATPNLLESQHDGRWHWNSVRVPWRMGTTYMLFGNMPVGNSTLYDLIIAPLDNFARTRPLGLNIGTMNMDGTNTGNPGAGQRRDFATPFVVTAAARGDHPEQWVDDFWGSGTVIPDGMHHWANNVYGDYFRLISLITASGNYWIP